MTSDDYLGLFMFAVLAGMFAIMVRDGIKTRRIYRRMEEAERIERAERAARNAGVTETGHQTFPHDTPMDESNP